MNTKEVTTYRLEVEVEVTCQTAVMITNVDRCNIHTGDGQCVSHNYKKSVGSTYQLEWRRSKVCQIAIATPKLGSGERTD